ncbi:MAG: hypothetical protein GY906_04565 [bacterium]|nr:hypothetical protein [bacterium]
MAVYECTVCGHIYDESAEELVWADLPDDWVCPVCAADMSYFEPRASSEKAENGEPDQPPTESNLETYLSQWKRSSDEIEPHLVTIQQASISGSSVLEPMRSRLRVVGWNDLLFAGAQLAKLPLNEEDPIATQTVIGPNAAHPLVIDTPIFVSHMSFGALSREAKIALARGSAAAGTAMCSGEGGILPESQKPAHRYIFEYVPNRYSVTDENLRAADAIEIKIGQSAKPGVGGHLPGHKVTDEIAAVRGFPAGKDIISPARYADISTAAELKAKVEWLREVSHGKPIGIKIAAGHIEADIDVAISAGPDFITIDGRAGATGAASKVVKDSTSVPTVFALWRARRHLDTLAAEGVSLLITGGLRVSSDFAKALALGADAVAIGTAAMIACGCQQYRICHTGNCPVGIATQNPELRRRLDIDLSAQRVENFFRVSTDELKAFARLTGNDDVHSLIARDLMTTSSEIAAHTEISHVGQANALP